MDDARQDFGRRIVEMARLALLVHLQQEQDAQAQDQVSASAADEQERDGGNG